MFGWNGYRERRRLRRALDTMPALPRDVIERLLFNDHDYHRIAADLELTVAQVERNVADAMYHLSSPDIAGSAQFGAWLCRPLRRVWRR
jgi:DNA-directed RNA polymerase specialized sigma24 family protein